MTPFFVFFRVVAACRSSLSPAFFSLSVFRAFSHFHFGFGRRRSCPGTARFCANGKGAWGFEECFARRNMPERGQITARF